MTMDMNLPAISNCFEIANSEADFPLIIPEDWPSLHSIFRPDKQVGTCIYDRRVNVKSEIVIRNYFGTGRFKRNFQYLDGADQELKIERYSGCPYKIRLSDTLSKQNYSCYWDNDHPLEHSNSWNKGWREYIPFPNGLTRDDVFFRLEEFAKSAITLMTQGQMPDFSELNQLTGMDFKKPPFGFSQSYSFDDTPKPR